MWPKLYCVWMPVIANSELRNLPIARPWQQRVGNVYVEAEFDN